MDAVEVNDSKEENYEAGADGADLDDETHVSQASSLAGEDKDSIKKVKRTFTVGDPELRSSSFYGKWQSYKVTTAPAVPDVTSVHRRYRDFVWLRDSLQSRHQGIFFPPLPPKKALARFDEDFIQERRADLERFLNRLLELSFVEQDPAFTTFISRHEDRFDEAKKKLEEDFQQDGAMKPKDRATKLREFFPEVDSYDVGTDTDEHILRLKEAVLDGVEKNYARKPEPERLAVMNQFESWAEAFKSESTLYGRYLEDQIKYEYQDIRAFLETVAQRDAINSAALKAKAKGDKWRANKDQFLNEKNTKQKDEDLSNEEDLNDYLSVLSKLILGNQIQLAWNKKVENFRESVLKFAEEQLSNSQKLSEVWESMLHAADTSRLL